MVSRFRKPRGVYYRTSCRSERNNTGTDVCGGKKKRLRTKGVQRGVGRNLINLFIKRFSCLCWGCQVPTGNTRRLNEYRRRRRRWWRSEEAGVNPAARGNRREAGRGKSGIRHGYPLPNEISVEYRRPPKVRDTQRSSAYAVWRALEFSSTGRAFSSTFPRSAGRESS